MVLRDYDLAIIVRDILNLPKTTTKVALHFRIVRAFKRALVRALQNEDYVSVAGFGIFRVHNTKPRRQFANVFVKGKRGPRFSFITKSKKVVRFHPSKPLKRFVQEGLCQPSI